MSLRKYVKINSVQCRGTGTVQSTSFTENMAGKTGRIFVAKPEILGDVYIVCTTKAGMLSWIFLPCATHHALLCTPANPMACGPA